MLKKGIIMILIVGVGIQLAPAPINESDETPETDFFKTTVVPVDIQRLVKASCYDCHSNNTNYPWYGRIRPFAWFLQKHIREGKAELNFSTFQDYSGRMQREKIRSMISQIEDREMPLKQYLWMHPEAKLSQVETEQLIDFFENLNANN